MSAPAGSGKTTLLSAWLDECSCPSAWMSLDESDSEMPVFLRYFVAASQRYARRLEATSGLPVELAVMSEPRQRRSVLARLMTKGKEQPSK